MNNKLVAKELLKVAKALMASAAEPETPKDWSLYMADTDEEKKQNEKAAKELTSALSKTKNAIAKAISVAYKENMKPVLKKWSDVGADDMHIAEENIAKYLKQEVIADINW